MQKPVQCSRSPSQYEGPFMSRPQASLFGVLMLRTRLVQVSILYMLGFLCGKGCLERGSAVVVLQVRVSVGVFFILVLGPENGP